jgi:hypothetical protein
VPLVRAIGCPVGGQIDEAWAEVMAQAIFEFLTERGGLLPGGVGWCWSKNATAPSGGGLDVPPDAQGVFGASGGSGRQP